MRSAWVIASTTIIFGLLLWYADVKGKQVYNILQLRLHPSIIELKEYVTAEVSKNPDKVFLVDSEQTFTFSEFNELINQCCHYFKYLGIGDGDTISFILRNSVDFLILYFVCFFWTNQR